MAGLLAANMLRRYNPVIYEAQPSLPHNHAALLRFRSDAVSKATGIPFRKVEVSKGIIYRDRMLSQPDIEVNNMYSEKVTGTYRPRSIGDLRTVERYIAPPDFIAQMARNCRIEYGAPLKSMGRSINDPAISTIPMVAMMKLMKWEKAMTPNFQWSEIWSHQFKVVRPFMDLYQTIYYPDPSLPYYRASITGNVLIVEYCRKPETPPAKDLANIACDFGISNRFLIDSTTSNNPLNHQVFGKLLPLAGDDELERRKFITHLSDEYKVYSLGRFATWRQLLMDDIVKDVERIDSWISVRGSSYDQRLQS